MNDNLISIIVPVYNVEKYIHKCVDSIISQTYTNLQIILVDDGSTDHCGEICDQYAAKDNRITVIHNKNNGVSSARNCGLSHVKGEYVLFIDSDDWIETVFVQKICEFIDNNQKADIFLFDYYEYKSEDKRRQYFNYDNFQLFRKEETDETRTIRFLQTSMLSKSMASMYNSTYSIGVPWGKAYRTEIIKNNNINFDTSLVLNEDVIFNIEVFDCCKTVLYCAEPMYHYRLFEESSVKKINKNPENAISVRMDIIVKLGDIKKKMPYLKKAVCDKQFVHFQNCMDISKENRINNNSIKKRIMKVYEKNILFSDFSIILKLKAAKKLIRFFLNKK